MRSTVALCIVFGLAIPAIIPLANNWELLSLAYLFLGLPIIGVIATIRAATCKSWLLFLLSLLILSCGVLVLRHSELVRQRERWILFASQYKSELLSSSKNERSLRHMEWDGWGGFGAGDATRYLVFDPSDSLADLARSGVPGKVPHLPCQVPRVSRLEKHWYSIVTYTDSDWDHCP